MTFDHATELLATLVVVAKLPNQVIASWRSTSETPTRKDLHSQKAWVALSGAYLCLDSTVYTHDSLAPPFVCCCVQAWQAWQHLIPLHASSRPRTDTNMDTNELGTAGFMGMQVTGVTLALFCTYGGDRGEGADGRMSLESRLERAKSRNAQDALAQSSAQ